MRATRASHAPSLLRAPPPAGRREGAAAAAAAGAGNGLGTRAGKRPLAIPNCSSSRPRLTRSHLLRAVRAADTPDTCSYAAASRTRHHGPQHRHAVCSERQGHLGYDASAPRGASAGPSSQRRTVWGTPLPAPRFGRKTLLRRGGAAAIRQRSCIEFSGVRCAAAAAPLPAALLGRLAPCPLAPRRCCARPRCGPQRRTPERKQLTAVAGKRRRRRR